MGDRADDLWKRVYCSSCGASSIRRHGLLGIAWQEMSDASGRRIALCPDCVRRNLWLIEGRLDIDPGAGI